MKKSYLASLSVFFPITNDDGSVVCHNSYNVEVFVILKNKNDKCTCHISSTKMMQCKRHIIINRIFDISKIDACRYQRKGIT